jgi:hypothetical protein
MDLNLDTLKQEILEYLEQSEFAIFRSVPGGLEGMSMVLWDTERYPDYRMLLEAAQKAGVKMILFASSEFDIAEIDEVVEQLEECELTREERRDLEARLRDLRVHEGITCSIELSFDLHGRMYVYEVHPDWYDEFLSIGDEISVNLPGGEEDQDDGSFGYFSNN